MRAWTHCLTLCSSSIGRRGQSFPLNRRIEWPRRISMMYSDQPKDHNLVMALSLKSHKSMSPHSFHKAKSAVRSWTHKWLWDRTAEWLPHLRLTNLKLLITWWDLNYTERRFPTWLQPHRLKHSTEKLWALASIRRLKTLTVWEGLKQSHPGMSMKSKSLQTLFTRSSKRQLMSKNSTFHTLIQVHTIHQRESKRKSEWTSITNKSSPWLSQAMWSIFLTCDFLSLPNN